MSLECTSRALMIRSDELESGTAFFSAWALASGPAHCLEINNVRPVKCDLSKHCDFLIEPASGYFVQIVANHAHEDHVRLSLAAKLQHTGHVSAWLDFPAKITGGGIKHPSKFCALRVARHAV